jgi:hypothetical protein
MLQKYTFVLKLFGKQMINLAEIIVRANGENGIQKQQRVADRL